MRALAAVLLAAPLAAATLSPLYTRGYTVLPSPQRIELKPGEFRFGAGWRIDGPGDALREELRDRFGLSLAAGAAGVVQLSVRPGSVEIGDALDRDRAALAAQAYRLELAPGRIAVSANAAPGLFYGIETLVQLLSRDLTLPEGVITDWPDLELRQIYWDDAHHLDRLPELKRAVRQAAFFKINGFVIKLEGHFQYRSAPAVVEPQALSPAEFQELTGYGLRYHVQVIPYLDGPAHIAFILKHPEYAALRSFPQSNYELCSVNPDSYKLLTGMFQDLMDANRGVRYVYLSTDEAYYIGLADSPQCREKGAGTPSQLLAQFVSKMADYLHGRGRTVVFWGEYPLEAADIPLLPAHLINGEVYGKAFDSAFKARGIRQTIFTNAQSGEAKLFPDDFLLPASRRLHPAAAPQTDKITEGFRTISFNEARENADVMGAVVAGWADMGLHAETFWLGYAVITAAAWRPGAPDPQESEGAFFRLFYGPRAAGMARVYQLMSTQAQTWRDLWESVPSTSRKPIFGSSYRIYETPQPAHDQAITLPDGPAWLKDNARRLELASESLADNDELLGLLYGNLERVERNRYNLEVFLSIARLYRHNLRLLLDLGRIARLLEGPRAGQALAIAQEIPKERERVLADLTATWYKSWHRRVEQANGRRFLHELDDVKDHLADRTVDLGYLVQRERLLPWDKWMESLRARARTP